MESVKPEFGQTNCGIVYLNQTTLNPRCHVAEGYNLVALACRTGSDVVRRGWDRLAHLTCDLFWSDGAGMSTAPEAHEYHTDVTITLNQL